MVLAAMDEVRVEAERDVVQEDLLPDAADVDPPLLAVDERVEGADRIVPVQAEVAREVVPGPEGDADERKVALDRNGGDRRQRAVAPGHAERIRLRTPGHLGRILTVRLHDVRLYAAAARLLDQVIRARVVVTRARVDQQKTGQAGLGLDGLEPE
jgi:hypothetical protein